MSEIDRITATRRPKGKARGFQRWNHLLFLHWRVPVDVLRALVPTSLDIDCFEGEAFIGLVPFEMRGVRPAWAPAAVAFNFLETNLRTYVHVAGRDPGVYFFSLEAASRIAVATARAGWSLPYHFARMSMQMDEARVAYETRRQDDLSASLKVNYSIGAALPEADPSSLEFFLFERYLLHTERSGRLLTGQVNHTPYPVHRAETHSCEDGLVVAAGLPKLGPPELSHYSPGVSVEVFNLGPRAD